MSATRVRRDPEDSVPQVPQSTPSAIGYGSAGHDFTLQAVMELQKSVGELNANVVAMRGSLDSVKSKVDDLVGWKNRILGGVAVFGVVVAVAAFVLGKASEYITFRAPLTAGSSSEQPAGVTQSVTPRPVGKN